jgi:hypothetical protein
VTEHSDQSLRVVKGEPTPEELAALVAVVSAKVAAAGETQPTRPSTWAAYWRSVRRPLPAGPGAWRASGLPR